MKTIGWLKQRIKHLDNDIVLNFRDDEGVVRPVTDLIIDLDEPRANIVSLGFDEEVQQFIRDGQFIMAVKTYREKTLCGLKEAKDYCDMVRAKMYP